MDSLKDGEVQSPEARKEAYLSRLSQNDQDNLRKIGEQFKKVMQEEERKGVLVAVGGTVNKPLPRKDIDILVVLQPHQGDIQRGTSTELDFALKDFQTFRRLIENALNQDPQLQIKEVIEPAMDEEFGSPSILKTDGSIVVASKEEGGMPIEFIRISERGSYQEVAAGDKRPFVILEQT
ncbi:MAG: hypothetical protein Q7R77_03345 [Candidatus Daviesbacteria bacterium]|nr:hypothetical protein [Candidatus Daviesbacteria bacterium]